MQEELATSVPMREASRSPTGHHPAPAIGLAPDVIRPIVEMVLFLEARPQLAHDVEQANISTTPMCSRASTPTQAPNVSLTGNSEQPTEAATAEVLVKAPTPALVNVTGPTDVDSFPSLTSKDTRYVTLTHGSPPSPQGFIEALCVSLQPSLAFAPP